MNIGFANGVEYLETGQGGIPILCLHGIGGSFDSFRPQLQALGGDRRVLAWNMPGYGHSPLLVDTSFASLRSALIGFLDALEIERAHVLGHSIGGMLAQELALVHPERVASLALLATTAAFGGRDDSFRLAFLQARLQPLEQGASMAQLAAQFVPEMVGSQTGAGVFAAATATMAAVPEASYRAILRCLVTFDRYQDSGRLDVPACLIAGSEDCNASPATMRKMAAKMPQAVLHVLDGVGHLVNLEAAVECNRLLGGFYRQQA